MSNSIWHKASEKPICHKWVCVKYPNAPVKATCKFIEENTYISYVCEYAYLDDLIAQADKAERLQKAVDKALQVLDNVSEIGGIDLEIAKIKQLIKD